MKKYLILILVFITIFTCGCENSNPVSKQEIYAMNTIITISVYGNNKEIAVKACVEEINRLDALFSVTNMNSDICKINTNSGSAVVVSKETFDLIEQAKILCEKTNGALDISVYPLVKAWGFTTDNNKIPNKDELSRLLKNVDYSKIETNRTNVSVKIPKGAELDLGAVAKGYTGEKLNQILKKYNVACAIINLGGNIQTVGTKSKNEKWSIGIQDPQDDNYFATISVAETSVITSGGYQRNFKKDGITYHHILDPKTGYPANNGIISSTIISSNGTSGDAISTALYVMGTEKALNFYKNNKTFEMILVTNNNKIYVSDSLKESFTLLNENKMYTLEYV